MPSHAALLEALANRIASRIEDGVLRIGIDGVDGAGKTTLADELAVALRARGSAVIRSGIDGFHNPRSIRYAKGQGSPEGFYRDSFDLGRVRELLLDPLSPGGSGRYRTRAFDHRTDRPVEAPVETAQKPSILMFDGIFLQRPDLRRCWDITIFLDVPFAESYRRMAARDGSDPNPKTTTNRRYYEGQKIYFAECRPREQANVLVDYADVEALMIVRG